jgi:hypothetical protein
MNTIRKHDMARKDDLIPYNDAEFDMYFKNLCQLVGQRTGGTPPVWDHIPPAAVTKLTDSYAAWYTAYAVTLKPHTPLDTDAKNRAKDAGTDEIRSFINEFIRYSSKVSVADRESLGIFGRTPPRPVPAPTTVPELDPEAGHTRQVVIHYRDKARAPNGGASQREFTASRYAGRCWTTRPRVQRNLSIHPSTPAAPLPSPSTRKSAANAFTWPAAGKSSAKESRGTLGILSRRLCLDTVSVLERPDAFCVNIRRRQPLLELDGRLARPWA